MMALDDDDIVSRLGKKIGGADADDAASDHGNLFLLCHVVSTW
jgi:hypothetical protein